MSSLTKLNSPSMVPAIAGVSGFSGFSGYRGQTGAPGGTSGYSGQSGFSGLTGPTGSQGSTGISGTSGYSGIPGSIAGSGYSGYTGYSGISGYSGSSGYSGYSGNSGYSGVSGYSGNSGYLGISGYSGGYGSSGYSGVSGYSGGIIASSDAQVRSLGVNVASDGVAGNIRATGVMIAYYSDRRLKQDITRIENALAKLEKISGVTYKQNKLAEEFGYQDYSEQVGVIAQDVQEVMPQVVKPAPFDMDENNLSRTGENYITVQYEKLVPLLIEAIKEINKTVKELNTKVDTLIAGK